MCVGDWVLSMEQTWTPGVMLRILWTYLKQSVLSRIIALLEHLTHNIDPPHLWWYAVRFMVGWRLSAYFQFPGSGAWYRYLWYPFFYHSCGCLCRYHRKDNQVYILRRHANTGDGFFKYSDEWYSDVFGISRVNIWNEIKEIINRL